MSTKILVGDCRERLKDLPDESVHCVVTSPPYWGLRDYGIPPSVWGGTCDCEHQWGSEIPGDARGGSGPGAKESYANGGKGVYGRQVARGSFCRLCGAWMGTLGLEPTFELHLQHLVSVFREVRRVLRKDGTVWLNYGDAYAGSWGNYQPTGKGGQRGKETERWDRPAYDDVSRRPPASHKQAGLKPKDLMLMPSRVALALQADGWWVRSEIVWNKPNPMPESVRDRPTSAHEKVFLLTKSARYFYDAEAVRVPVKDSTVQRLSQPTFDQQTGGPKDTKSGNRSHRKVLENLKNRSPESESGANLRNVWKIATTGFKEAHFATFPPKLVEPCIKAGTSEHGVCSKCGAPWVRQVSTVKSGPVRTRNRREVGRENTAGGFPQEIRHSTIGWKPTCKCGADVVPAIVLDPFGGAGTVALVADQLRRHCILIEISPEYAEMSKRRIIADCPPILRSMLEVSVLEAPRLLEERAVGSDR